MNTFDRWTPSTVEGRWCGLGPYYAMFPVEFTRRVVNRFCPPGGGLIDPFCGRGTAPFVASVTGRRGLGVDVNPVAWLYTSVKLNPCPNPELILKRVRRIISDVHLPEKIAQNAFQEWAWHREVLGFLRCARRELNWRGNRTDRTLMALILVHLHAKRGEGLSNQLRQSKSMSPDYSVRWWKEHKLRPPEIDLEAFFEKKLKWRYAKGSPDDASESEVRLGDARRILPQLAEHKADLLLTSPPYFGVTNYEYDNWIRLWMLGGPPLPSYRTAARHANSENYKALLAGTFEQAQRHCKSKAVVYVRTDAREYTHETTISILEEVWPDHRLYQKYDKPKGKTQTGLFQTSWDKAGEVDLLLLPPRLHAPKKFERLRS